MEKLVEITADIVSAYVSKNPIPRIELESAIRAVHTTLRQLSAASQEAPPPVIREPAVSIRKSVTSEYIICLEDGKKFKSMKRHLQSAYKLTPEQYREKWKLPADYPMVAPAYAERRSALAKSTGLGLIRRKAGAKK